MFCDNKRLDIAVSVLSMGAVLFEIDILTFKISVNYYPSLFHTLSFLSLSLSAFSFFLSLSLCLSLSLSLFLSLPSLCLSLSVCLSLSLPLSLSLSLSRSGELQYDHYTAPAAHMELGLLHLDMGKLDEAEKILELAK